MKKIIVILLCVFITGVLMSCEKTNMKSTSTTGDAEIVQTTASADKKETASTNQSITTNYEDTFESFMIFPNVNDYFFGKVYLDPGNIFSGSSSVVSLVLFRVVDVEEEYSEDFTVYHVQIEDIYGIDNYDTEKVYRMAWRGHLDEQLYGRPPLEIGGIYGRFLTTSENHLASVDLWQASLIYDVEEVEGKQYLYGYGVDLSNMKCKILITDPEENSIYKVGKHDKAIAKLKELDRELPTFDYKAEAEALYNEYTGNLS